MNLDEEKTNLLGKNNIEKQCFCASLICSMIAFVAITIAIVVVVVASPVGIVSVRQPYIHLQYFYQGVVPSMDAQNVVFSAFQTWTEYIYALDAPHYLDPGTYCDDLVLIDTPMTYAGILIAIEFTEIDGEGDVVAFAGPCVVDVNRIPRLGVVVVDTADVQGLMDIGEYLLQQVIMHEIAHVLGIGTLWSPNITYSTPASSPNAGYLYQLNKANIAHFSYGGGGSGARVEDTGGSGTAGSHWKEGVYGNEIMTGYIDVDAGGNILSRVTLGGLEDIGYSINYNHPDMYVLPTRRRLRSTTRIYHVNDSINFLH
jgi:hypothetical protein